jgi:hypothetical protein
MTIELNYLPISWAISRGRDTYGYNICRLDDNNTGKRYRCNGGGYDMQGTVLGQWLKDVYQDRLQLLKTHGPNGAPVLVDCGYSVPGYLKREDLYGLTFNPKGEANIDGACGVGTVIKIAEACGINITSDWNRRSGRKNGFFIS